jgi:hypothetical protein
MTKPTPRLSRSQRVTPEDIRLRSDFVDFYDHHFAGNLDGDRPKYERYASQRDRTREIDHLLLRCAGLETPPGQALGNWPGETLVVAYTDPRAHRGDGKRLGTVDELLADGVLSVTYSLMVVGWPYSRGRSLRLLSCGRSHYWLDYRQRDPAEWRSNVGDVAGEGRWLAVDLNTAPGIRGTPVEQEPRAARDVAESIAMRWGELCL